MTRHANDLDFLLNPGAGSAETDADEHKEERLRHGDDNDDAETSDASPSNKIALAFILDTPQEALERESAGPTRLDRRTDRASRRSICSSFKFRSHGVIHQPRH